MTDKSPDRLATFLTALTRQVDRGLADEEQFLRSTSELLAELVAFDDWLEQGYSLARQEHYQQYLLALDPRERFSVVSFVWGPGQQTPIHDHTVWGIVGMLRGAEISQRFNLCEGRLVEGSEETLQTGQVVAFSPRTGDIHRVRNALADGTSISIHVYGGNIGRIERHAYDVNGVSKPFISGYSNLGRGHQSDPAGA